MSCRKSKKRWFICGPTGVNRLSPINPWPTFFWVSPNTEFWLQCSTIGLHAKDRAQRMVVIPRYEPVFVEPNLKQYEVHIVFQIQLWTFLTHIVSPQVQVLQKSMNLDDMDGSTGQRLGRQPGRSNIEARRFDPGVSYITTWASVRPSALQAARLGSQALAPPSGQPLTFALSECL